MRRGAWWAMVLGAGLLVIGAAPSSAEVPRTIQYQGRLTEPDGSPLTGEQVLMLRLYDAATEGAKVWEEQHEVALAASDNGVFAVILGSRTPFGPEITFTEPLWLTIEVGTDGEFSPRQPLSAVGYAINADRLDGLDSTGLARADHVHTPVPAPEGVRTIAADGQPGLTGDPRLAAGSNVTLSQAGQTITIAASGAGAPGARDSNGATNTLAIGTAADTTLATVTITKIQAASRLLVIANAQLAHTANPNDKTVTLRLFRDAAQLDADYAARIGTANRTVSELPVSLHAWDAPGAGTYTYSLRARSTGAGAQATVRRLTVIELP